MKQLKFKIQKASNGKWVSEINGKLVTTWNHPSIPNVLYHLMKLHVKGFSSLRGVDSVTNNDITVSYV